MKHFLIFLLVSVQVWAVDGITLGSVTLKSTYECISISQAFTGNDASGASVVAEISPAGAGTWVTVQAPYVDMRATLNGTANPLLRTARGSIVGLTQNVSYDVRLTWTSGAGVTGTNPVTTTISTNPTTIPVGATVIDATTDAEFTTARGTLAGVGGTIRLANGTYEEFTFSQSGISSSWIKVIPLNAGQVTIGAGTFAVGIAVSGSYVLIDGLGFTEPNNTSAGTNNACVSTTGDHIQIKNCVLRAGPGTTASKYYTGVFVNSASEDVRVESNTITTTSTRTYNTSFVYGVFFDSNSLGSHVIMSNSLAGAGPGTMFRDGIGAPSSIGSGPGQNTDICYNTFADVDDDSIEAEGRCDNVRIWGNIVTQTDPGGNGEGSCVAQAGPWCGPIYIFRNYFKGTAGSVAVKQGVSEFGPSYFYHNTFDVTGAGTADVSSNIAGTPYSQLTTWRNNVMKGARYTVYSGGGPLPANGNQRTDSYDYNLHYTTNGTYINQWNVSLSYNTLNLWKAAATDQEVHGTSGNPLLNADGTLQTGSPAIDLGVSLPNFNGANSPWPTYGSAPDAGAFEFVPASTSPAVMTRNPATLGVGVSF